MTSQERAYNTCLEMLQQRGYEIIDEDRENMQIVALKPNGEQMMTMFNNALKFNVKSMQEVISTMNTMELRHALVIYQAGITPATKSSLVQLEDMHIELFSEEDLQINITKHRLQPKFERLVSKEAEEFKKKYGLKIGTLRSDKPISMFFHYQKGDIIRVTRPSGYITYRIVKG